MTESKPLTALVAGHSNAVAIHKGFQLYGEETGRQVVVRRLNMTVPDKWPNWRDGALHPRIAEQLEKAKANNEFDVMVACVRGSFFHQVGLMRHPVPFDFILDGDDRWPLLEDAVFMTQAEMRRVLSQGINERTLYVLSAMAEILGPDLVCLAPPPPIFDNGFIMSNDLLLSQDDHEWGVSDPRLRWKIWRLYTMIVEEHCREIGIRYLLPPETATENGYLREDCWFHDAIHGNDRYGRLVVDQLLALEGGRSSLSSSAA